MNGDCPILNSHGEANKRGSRLKGSSSPGGNGRKGPGTAMLLTLTLMGSALKNGVDGADMPMSDMAMAESLNLVEPGPGR